MPAASPPRLETPRLILRALAESDLDAYARIFGDPEVAQYLGEGKPLDRVGAWRSIAWCLGHWQLRGYGLWALEEKATGRFVGRVGTINPEGWPGFEVGWALAKDCWGKGYATESARRVLEYAFTELDQPRVISLVIPENTRSIRVAERIGEKLTGSTTILGRDALVYGLEREDWRRLRA